MVRFSWFVGCLLAGFLGLIGTASAASYPDQQSALTACFDEAEYWISGGPNPNTYSYSARCYLNPGPTKNKYLCKVLRTLKSNGNLSWGHCSAGGSAVFTTNGNENATTWYGTDHNQPSCTSSGTFCFTNNTCSGKNEFTSTTIRPPRLSSNVCYQSCQYTTSFWYVGTYPAGHVAWTFTPTGSVCSPTDDEPEPVPPDSPEVEDPLDPDVPLDLPPEDGGVKKPIDPGPGRDENGHGTSSGGGTCDAPPACSGEPIQCNILFQTWSTRCALGGEGSGDGDSAADEVRGLRDDLGDSLGSDGGVGDGAGLSDFSGLVGTKTFGVSDIDSAGWGFPRTCPLWDDVIFTVAGSSIMLPLSTFTLHCQIFDWTGLLIVAFAAYWSVMLLIRSD